MFGFGDAEAAVEGTTQKRDESSFVSQTQRHHTAASLFNILYGYLREDDECRDVSEPEHLIELKAGQLIEFTGEYLGNPLEDILNFFGALKPYLDPDVTPAAAPANARSGNPAKKAAAAAAAQPAPAQATDNEGLKLMAMMAKDIEASPVHDLLFETSEGLEAVVTVATEFYNEGTKENLREGEFRVVGKVTKVLQDGDSINLTRRTVMGATGSDMAQDTIDGFRNVDELSLNVADPIVSGPAVQVLPMSIFV